MKANKSAILGGILLAVMASAPIMPLAIADPYQTNYNNGPTLEEQLSLAHKKVLEAQANPHAGSGTPVLDVNGVLGASIVVGAVFGGIAIAFVVQAKRHSLVKMT